MLAAVRNPPPPDPPRLGAPAARMEGPVIIKSVARFLANFGGSYVAFFSAEDCSIEAVRYLFLSSLAMSSNGLDDCRVCCALAGDATFAATRTSLFVRVADSERVRCTVVASARGAKRPRSETLTEI